MEIFQKVATNPSPRPGAVTSVQSYGDSLNLHPHIHAIASRGVWSADGSFEAIPALDTQRLMLLFRHHVLRNPLAGGRINQAAVDILDRFHHPAFSAYEGEGVSAGDRVARERLSPPGRLGRFDRLTRYSGVLAPTSAFRPLIVPQKEAPSPAAHAGCQGGVATAKSESCAAKDQYGRRPRNYPWAQLMARVFEFDVLACPRCSARMRILAAINPPHAIRKILACLGLPTRAPPIAPAMRDDEAAASW